MSAPSAVNLDQTTADAICEALQGTLTDMFHIPISCGAHSIGKGSFDVKSCAVGMLDMLDAGQPVGIFIVAFAPSIVPQIQSAFGIPQTSDPTSTHDAIEEIVNVIYGSIKKSFNANGYRLRMGFPKLLDDLNEFFAEHAENKRIVVPFTAGGCKCHAAIMALRQ